MSTPENPHRDYSALTTIAVIAHREARAKIYSKAFLISTALLLILVVGGITLGSRITDTGPAEQTIGLVGGNTTVSDTLVASGKVSGTPVRIEDYPDEHAARAAAAAGNVDVALVPSGPNTYTGYTKDDRMPQALRSLIDGSLRTIAYQQALAEQDVDVTAANTAAASAGLRTAAAGDIDPDRSKRIMVAMAGLIILYIAVMAFCGYVATGVIEEKSSRVVEVIVATVRPLHLLWGKILGLGSLGLGMMALLITAAALTSAATGFLVLGGIGGGILASVLVSFVLGYLFYATLYAAAGSLVSRMEDFQSVQMPIIVIVMLTVYAPILLFAQLDATWMKVLTFVPPFSTSLVPMQVAAGNLGPFAAVAAFGLLGLATLGIAWLAARIYQRSVLHHGSSLSWRAALLRAGEPADTGV